VKQRIASLRRTMGNVHGHPLVALTATAMLVHGRIDQPTMVPLRPRERRRPRGGGTSAAISIDTTVTPSHNRDDFGCHGREKQDAISF
jgi:hypothetical protein